MTKDYLSAAIKIIVELEGKATTASIKSLQVITSIGVISGILGYLAKEQFPKITPSGMLYFGILIIVTWIVNFIFLKIYTNLKYKIKFTERAKQI